MFDCKQDIGLLHNSLLSVAYANSDNLFDCVEVKNAVHSVYDSIKMIMYHSLKTAKNEKEKMNSHFICSQRLHAALFFTTLRSHSIQSEAADEFYDSILYNWPSLGLKFYVELNFKCDWSEYFVMCALQLPTETLLVVLKIIFETPFESDIKCYSWHLILQTLIFKFLNVPSDKEVLYPFDFPFESPLTVKEKPLGELTEENCETIKESEKNKKNRLLTENCDRTNYKCDDIIEKCNIPDSSNKTLPKESVDSTPISVKITEHDDDESEEDEYLTPYNYEISDNDDDEATKTENEDLTHFKELCCNLFNSIALKLEESDEVDVLKILLHALKIISKFFKTGLIQDSTSILLFENFIKLLKNYFSESAKQDKFKTALTKCSFSFTRHAYAMVSWNVCLNYLIFLLEDNIANISTVSWSESLKRCESFFKDLVSVIHSLYSLNYPSLKSDEHVELLCKIIKFEFEGSSYAAKFFLDDEVLLKRNNVLGTLEENCHVINISHVYSIIVDHIMSSDSHELKQSLLKILYTCLQMNKLDMYNTVIGYIMSKYGLTEEFQLPDFKDLLSDITHQTPSQEELERKIPVLLIQNPKSTLEYLLEETLIQGPEGNIFIQFLKHFRNACFYMKKSNPVCILHGILDDYFKRPKLEPLFFKNMVILYEFLAQVHLETPILFPLQFFKECIIPKLYLGYDKIGLILECAYVLVPSLLSDDSFLKEPEILCTLIVKLGILTNYSIERGHGELKSLILPIIKELEIHQQKNKYINEKQKCELRSTFRNFDEMTCVYFEKFLPGDIELFGRAAIWIRYCKDEDLSNFKENFSVENLTYISLVNTLVQVLPHLTKNEWPCCINVLEVCCANRKVQEEILCSYNLFQLCESELNTYGVVLSVITSVNFILNGNIDGSSYLCSCASNFLKDIFFKEKFTQPQMFLSLILEISHLISSISVDLIPIYQTTLLEIKNELSSRSSEENDYNKFLNYVIAYVSSLFQDEIEE